MRYTLQQQLTARSYVLVNRYFDEARRQIALLTGREDIDLAKPVRWGDFSPNVRGQVEAVYRRLFVDLQRLAGQGLSVSQLPPAKGSGVWGRNEPPRKEGAKGQRGRNASIRAEAKPTPLAPFDLLRSNEGRTKGRGFTSVSLSAPALIKALSPAPFGGLPFRGGLTPPPTPLGGASRTGFLGHRPNWLPASGRYGQAGLPTLSTRIWTYVQQERDLMELTLTRVLREKKSPSDAVHLFARYLNAPDEMRRYIASEGDTALTQRAMQILNPGTGVYRDPVKNILRLLKTEINRATKTADWERMQASPYITGYRIKRSTRYHNAKAQGKKQLECELCDHLTGEYPKTFKFTGWHPNCECIVEPIFATDPAERKRIRQALKAGKAYTPSGTISELPRGLQAVYHRLSPRNRSVVDTAIKPYRKEQRTKTLQWAKEYLSGTSVTHPNIEQEIRFTTTGIKEAINQPHKHYEAKLKALKNIKERIEEGKYLGSAEDDKGRPIKFHYIATEIAGEASVIVLKENLFDGELSFYGITEK